MLELKLGDPRLRRNFREQHEPVVALNQKQIRGQLKVGICFSEQKLILQRKKFRPLPNHDGHNGPQEYDAPAYYAGAHMDCRVNNEDSARCYTEEPSDCDGRNERATDQRNDRVHGLGSYTPSDEGSESQTEWVLEVVAWMVVQGDSREAGDSLQVDEVVL